MALAAFQTAFSGNPLDRADPWRDDPDIFGTVLERADARVLVLVGEDKKIDDSKRVTLNSESQILTTAAGEIAWQPSSVCRDLPRVTLIFLGLESGAPRYAMMLRGRSSDFDAAFPADLYRFRDARSIGLKLGTHPSLGVIAQAKSVLLWHESHRFCAKCGAESKLIKAGYERICEACGAHHFPRTDPVVIMLVRRGEEALVGRGKGWPEGHYSALAGFLEPGETIEEACAREIVEEVGLRATRVRYVASQPWPWPSTLMIGVEAWVEPGELNIDASEIADAIWITRDDLRRSIRGEHPLRLLPPSYAIAHTLMRHWLEEA